MTTQGISDHFAFDARGLNALKQQAQTSSPESNRAVAKQFEALFLQTVLKSMRDATPRDGIFDSDQSRMYESMLDQQLAQVLATKGGGTGLAAIIEKQLSRSNIDPQSLGDIPFNPPLPSIPLPSAPAGIPLSRTQGKSLTPIDGGVQPIVGELPVAAPAIGGASPASRDFVSRIWPHAHEASQSTGIPAHFMVAQAALETGWGKSEPRLPDGRPSYNLFGIKAGKSWGGPVVAATTTEVVDGVAQKQVENFRAYGSYAEAFRDYANLLKTSPRYANVIGTQDAASFARGLQQAGYATDPMYASKLTRIIGGNALRSSLLQG